MDIFKTFVNQLQFEQSFIFGLKVKLLEKDFYYTYSMFTFLTSSQHVTNHV
jgi:hypothetical protein